MLETFFDHIAAELLLREWDDITHQLATDDHIYRVDFQIEHKLHHIVAKGVLDEGQSIYRNLMCECLLLG